MKMAILLQIVDGTNGINGAPGNRCYQNYGGLQKVATRKNAKISKGTVNHPDTENFDNSSFISKSTKFLYCSIFSSISFQNSDLNNFVFSFKDA